MSQANLLHSSSLPDLEGKFIDKGRLLLMSSLGCGTYGNVYRAVLVDSPKDQPRFYAVKCQKRASQGTSRDVFQRREIQLHQKVGNHPNIVSFHKAIYTERHIFCVLDVCEGVDLFRAIEEKRFVNNTALIKNAFMQISGAVQYCHDSGIYHRDIKPENILVSEDNRSLLLTDFGLSTRDRHSTQIGCGSKFYMSPECVGSRDFRIPRFDNLLNDIWSLGIVLTTLITRRLPWLCATLTDEHFSAYLSEPDFLLDALPISARTNNILRCVLHPNPSHRMTLNAFRRAVSNTDDFYV
ncbi:kinase-like protein, partial [Fistulina hepatica ATCC 64428]